MSGNTGDRWQMSNTHTRTIQDFCKDLTPEYSWFFRRFLAYLLHFSNNMLTSQFHTHEG